VRQLVAADATTAAEIQSKTLSVDVIGPQGQFIWVGGPAKANAVTFTEKTVPQLSLLKEYAEYYNTQGIAYFEQNTPPWLVKFAEDVLGTGNVKTFPPVSPYRPKL
jgi:hypothetical protein